MNICVRTVAYGLLHTNFFHTNFFCTNFCPGDLLSLRIFYIRTLHHTNICIRTLAYELLRTYFFQYELYPLRTFAYEQLRTNFMHNNYYHTYFGPTTKHYTTLCQKEKLQLLARNKIIALSNLKAFTSVAKLPSVLYKHVLGCSSSAVLPQFS